MYQRILVPIDGSPTSEKGLEEAIRLAKLTQGRLRLVHVIDELSFALAMDAYAGLVGDWLTELRANGARFLEEAKAKATAAGVEADTLLHDSFSNPVHDLICADAAEWPADLIVIGTHGRRGVGRLVMGSSAENVLRHAPVPVLLIRAPETEPKTPDAGSGHPSERLHLPEGTVALE